MFNFITDFFSGIFTKISAFFTSVLVFLGIMPAPVVVHLPVMTPVYQIAAVEDFKTVQGSCTDGKYIYVSIISSTTDTDGRRLGKIIKIDSEKFETVLTSESKYVDHANDMTCVDKNLYIVNNAPNYTTYTVMDCAKLTIKGTGTKEFNMYGIEYVPLTSRYYFGISASYDIMVQDTINNTQTKISLQNNGYTRQGIASDGEYLYCLYSDPNIIYKYDFDGNFMGKMTLSVKENEAESLFFINGQMYVVYNIPGVPNGTPCCGTIYKVDDIQFS